MTACEVSLQPFFSRLPGYSHAKDLDAAGSWVGTSGLSLQSSEVTGVLTINFEPRDYIFVCLTAQQIAL